jgi:ubiquinone/menaquinone biosynthesis C-methylase UbiE
MKAKILEHMINQQNWAFDENSVLRLKKIKDNHISFPSLIFEFNTAEEGSDGWWTMHRNLILTKSLKKHKTSEILEVGAGNGGVAKFLHSKNIDVVCLEPYLNGASQIASQGILSICGSLDELKLSSSSIAAIGFFDVLEHIEYPQAVLSEAHRVLEENSLIYIMVPAHQYLFSNFDKQIGHFRRYSKSNLRTELEEAGFEMIETRFMFVTLLPVVMFQRIVFKAIQSIKVVKEDSLFVQSTSSTIHPNRFLNSFLLRILSWERAIDVGKILPGVSLMMVAKKGQLEGRF